MKIELHRIKVKDVFKGYKDSAEEGVIGYGGKLNIRPKYQREFIYDEEKRNAVIDTIQKNFPLNIMYWAKNDDGTFEVMDGQQRTISFCQYLNGDFSYKGMFFHNLTRPEQDKITEYELMVYFCVGNDQEKLDWFRVINIAGERLTNQELLNATYTGPWLTSAKSYFSKTNCPAYGLAKDYVVGSPIRQDYLETALSWITNGKVREYMATHQHQQNADELWNYFRNVIDWVKATFINYRKEMKGINWGELYNKYKNQSFDAKKLEKEIGKLMLDDDVTNKKGIYYYVLTRDERYLNIRVFTESQKRQVYEMQKGICPDCKKERKEKIQYSIEEMEADHIKPWRDGGKTEIKNCQMLCKMHNRLKGSK